MVVLLLAIARLRLLEAVVRDAEDDEPQQKM